MRSMRLPNIREIKSRLVGAVRAGVSSQTMKENNSHVYVIDDDSSIRASLKQPDGMVFVVDDKDCSVWANSRSQARDE
jgi:hypothetical protein